MNDVELPDHDDPPAAARLALEIRRRRKAAGLSQPQMASRIGYTRQYVSLAERVGRNLPSRELVTAIDRVLGAAGVLNALRDQAKLDQQARRRRTGTDAVKATESTSHDRAVAEIADPRGSSDLTKPSDDTAVQVISPEVVEEMLVSAADESTDFLAWAETTNVGELTIEQMHAEVRRVARSYLKVPTLPLFARTKALRDHSFTLLAGHQDPRHSRELYAVAGWSLTVLSWMSVDLGHAEAAENHGRAAWACAERADHNGLRAWVRATQHTSLFWQGNYIGAARYATDGLGYTGTGTATLFLSSALALNLARAGDADAAARALERAQRAAESAARAEDEPAGPLTCSVDRAASLWSDTELALGRAEGALALANRAVAMFEATAEEQRNRGSERMTRLQQVKAHLVLGDLSAAAEALQPVLDTPPAHRVRPLAHRVAEVGMLAAQAGREADPIARRIRAAVASFRRDSTTKELTA
ncbi:helix-turn-helix transcriptional regulator [Actinosynnema sp. NPDC023587]|uniref:helix-turn-helix transcriptional regulator n=1 Tax=Actinosynnema sp. NPDC023587 TaxID=3154695 RepID=UPI0033E98508